MEKGASPTCPGSGDEAEGNRPECLDGDDAEGSCGIPPEDTASGVLSEEAAVCRVLEARLFSTAPGSWEFSTTRGRSYYAGGN